MLYGLFQQNTVQENTYLFSCNFCIQNNSGTLRALIFIKVKIVRRCCLAQQATLKIRRARYVFLNKMVFGRSLWNTMLEKESWRIRLRLVNKRKHTLSCLQRVRLQRTTGCIEQISIIKIIDCHVKKFSYKEYPLTTSSFFCTIYLL